MGFTELWSGSRGRGFESEYKSQYKKRLCVTQTVVDNGDVQNIPFTPLKSDSESLRLHTSEANIDFESCQGVD